MELILTMAKKKSKENETPSSTDKPLSDSAAASPVVDYEEDELELLQVDLGDMVKIKQVLDETVASAILENIAEDYGWDNFKLGIMALSCVFAMIAQFAPIPFPESRPVLGVCGALYFALSGILQFVTTFIDKDCILWTKPADISASTKNKDMHLYGLRIRSNLPRFSEWYEVILEFQKPKQASASPMVKHTWSIGQFFDKEGYFDEIGLSQEIDKLFKRFEAKDYDSAGSDEKKRRPAAS